MAGEEKPVVTSIGKLIDGTTDELAEHLKDKDLGYVHSLRVLIEQTYAQFVQLKDTYMDNLSKSTIEAERIMLNGAIDKVYSELFKIEEKQTYLVEYEKLHQIV